MRYLLLCLFLFTAACNDSDSSPAQTDVSKKDDGGNEIDNTPVSSNDSSALPDLFAPHQDITRTQFRKFLPQLKDGCKNGDTRKFVYTLGQDFKELSKPDADGWIDLANVYLYLREDFTYVLQFYFYKGQKSGSTWMTTDAGQPITKEGEWFAKSTIGIQLKDVAEGYLANVSMNGGKSYSEVSLEFSGLEDSDLVVMNGRYVNLTYSAVFFDPVYPEFDIYGDMSCPD